MRSNFSDASITILIVDDHPVVRNTLRQWLSVEFPRAEIRVFRSAEDLCAKFDALQPATVLMDISLPGMNGIEATKIITARYPGTRVVLFSIHDSPAYREEGMLAGAACFVRKDLASTDLLPALRSLIPDISGSG